MTDCRVCGATTNAFLCRGCGNDLERAIGDMTSLMHELSLVATRQTRVYRANGKPQDDGDVEVWDAEQNDLPAMLRSREGRTALPSTALAVNLAARDLAWDLGNTLSTWARHIAEQRGTEPPTAEALVGWLLTNLDSIRFDEAAAEIHDEITYIHRRATAAVDRSPSRIYAGPCHADTPAGRCKRPLFAYPNADAIVCDGWRPDGYRTLDVGCRTEHAADDRQDWKLATFRDALLPIDDWRKALPGLFPELTWPTRSTWWKWANDGRLTRHGQTTVGEPTYRGGDIIELVLVEQSRIIANRDAHNRKQRRACA